MREVDLTSMVAKRLREELPGSVVFKHNDRFTASMPDLSVTWGGVTIWFEGKVAPIRGTDAQHQTMLRISRAGHAFYLVFDDEDTYVVSPEDIGTYRGTYSVADVVEFVRNCARNQIF